MRRSYRTIPPLIASLAKTNAMADSSATDVTQLVEAWSGGDRSALDKLLPLVSGELHQLAHQYMSRERPDHTLQTTALINEAYLKLIDQRVAKWQSRAHFFGIAAQIMRRILIDHARAHLGAKAQRRPSCFDGRRGRAW